MSRLYLVRHADSPFTPDEMRPLSEVGRADAERIAGILAPVLPEAIYSSPYRRARQTLEPLAGILGLPIQEVDDLRERTLSSGPVEDFVAAVRDTWDNFSFAHTGGESSAGAQRRVVDVVSKLASRHPMRPIVLATHGNLLALLMNHYDPSVGFDSWMGLSSPDIYRMEPATTAKVKFDRLWGATKSS